MTEASSHRAPPPSIASPRLLPVPALLASLLTALLAGCGSRGGGVEKGIVLERTSWGRLVRVVDVTGAEIRAALVIGQDIVSDGMNYELRANPVTEELTLKILHARGTPRFEGAYAHLEAGLGAVLPNGYSGSGPFSLVPRNAALRLEFSRPIDPATVDGETVQVLSGVPPAAPIELRYVIDPLEPDVLILDPTVTAFDQMRWGPRINPLGFPASTGPLSPNVTLRIPTRCDPAGGQLSVLRDASGGALRSGGNGPVDPTDPSRLVRTFRTGGPRDLNRGFLLDLDPPRLLGEQRITLLGQTASELSYEYELAACSRAPRPGDVIQQDTRLAEVTAVIDATPPDFRVEVERLDPGGDPFAISLPATLIGAYEGAAMRSSASCASRRVLPCRLRERSIR